jgi:hypothetical protein
MPVTDESKSAKPTTKMSAARLFFLSASGGQVLTANPDGSDVKVLVSGRGPVPDGVVVDSKAGHLYWTVMGVPTANDGSIERSNLDGTDVTKIVRSGGTFTPKQLQFDKKNRKLYWSDREGMRIMRADLDGSNLETLVDTSEGESRPGKDAKKWCVGIALDVERDQLYWTQKGSDNANEGRIFRAGIEIPKGQTPATRSDIELLYGGLPEPIDLELDYATRIMYWTDRGDPPRGNTVNRAPMDAAPEDRKAPEIVFNHLMEGIGIALDLKGGRMFLTDLGGSVYSAHLDGSSGKTLLVVQGNLTGIAYAEIPTDSNR